MNLKLLLGFLFALNLLFCYSAQGHALLIEASGREVIYNLDGAEVPINKLLDLAADIFEKEPDGPITIILDSRVPLNVAFNAIGVFGKAGFQRIDLFALSTRTKKMRKITMGLPEVFDRARLLPMSHE